MVSALPSSNWMVTTVSGAACAIAGPASRVPAARAAAATIRDCRPRTLFHLVMSYSFGPELDLPAGRAGASASRAERLIHSLSWLGTFPNQTWPVKDCMVVERRAGVPGQRAPEEDCADDHA